MFTCMDITKAPGGQGGRWHILWTDPPLSLLGINMRMGGFLQRGRKGELGSQSVNGVTTNPCSHNHTWKTRISQRQQIKTNNKIVGLNEARDFR